MRRSSIAGLYSLLIFACGESHATNSPPYWDSIPSQTASEGEEFSLQLGNFAHDDVGLEYLSFGLTWEGHLPETGPDGMSLDNGLIYWTPNSWQAGDYVLTATVTDQDNAQDTTSFHIVVANTQIGPPYWDPIPTQSANAGQEIALQLGTYAHVDGPPQYLTFEFTWDGHGEDTPEGISFDQGLILWTPETGQEAVYAFTATVVSQLGVPLATTNFQIHVTPCWDQIPDQVAAKGQLFGLSLDAHLHLGGSPQTVSYGIQWNGHGNLPPGMSVDLGTLLWTPANGHEGYQTFTVTAFPQQGGSVVGPTFRIEVVPYWDNVPGQSVSEGSPLSVVLGNYVHFGTIGGAISVTWNENPHAANGDTSPPEGMSAANGVVAWTPDSWQAGTFPLTVTATATGGGLPSSTTLSIAVTNATLGPSGTIRFGAHRSGVSNGFISSYLAAKDLQYIGAQWMHHETRPLYSLDGNYTSDISALDEAVIAAQNVGADLVVTLAACTDLNLAEHSNTGHLAHKLGQLASDPPLSEWQSKVTDIVHRYDMNYSGHMPGLTRSVLYWHVEEEDSFWESFGGMEDDFARWGQEYRDHLTATASVIRSANSSAKVIAMGLSSDGVWNAALEDGIVVEPPTIVIEALYGKKVRSLLSKLKGSGQYDVVDAHTYNDASIVRGRLQWIRLQLGADSSTAKIWAFEGGGPKTTSLYSDVQNVARVAADLSDAFANKAERWVQYYRPTTPENEFGDPEWRNMALIRGLCYSSSTGTYSVANCDLICRDNQCSDPGGCGPDSCTETYDSFERKWSVEAYRVMVEELSGFTSASDLTPRQCPSGMTTCTEEDLIHQVKFTRPNQVTRWVFWQPRGSRTFTLSTGSKNYLRVRALPVSNGVSADDPELTSYECHQSGSNNTWTLTPGPVPMIVEAYQGCLGAPTGVLAEEASREGTLTAHRLVQATGFTIVAPSNASNARLLVVDHEGRLVWSTDVAKAATAQEIAWRHHDYLGRRVANGLYLAVLVADGTAALACRVLVTQ